MKPSIVLLAAMIGGTCGQAFGLIVGGEGNDPREDPGWPAGAAAVFNTPFRVAWWEGPPFGGGQFRAECRGDAQALSAVLTDFAQADAKLKRVVLHDGVGSSVWLNPNRQADKRKAAQLDWVFMVWVPSSWEQMKKLPAELVPPDLAAGNADDPPMQIDVFTGGNVRWSEVVVPDGLEVVDERLEARGFRAADGLVLEGRARDLATGKPLPARVVLQRVEPQKKGGGRYETVQQTDAGADGRWTFRNVPSDWLRVVVDAEGFVPRIAGYVRDDQPGWRELESGLSRACSLDGQVKDPDGRPLEGVEVRLLGLTIPGAGRYETPAELQTETDAQGRFRMPVVPTGSTRVGLYKTGYCQPGLGPTLPLPATDVALKMVPAATIRVTVDFSQTVRPAEYIVELKPEGGEKVGKWSGSSQINAENQVEFRDVPPDRYVLYGHPNPYREDERSAELPLDLNGGEELEVTLTLTRTAQ